MDTQLLLTAGNHETSVSVPPGVSRIGSAGHCESRLLHEEMPAEALSLDNRGRTLLVQNLTSYDIFVGDQPLPPGQIAAWQPGVVIQLTRSISASLDEAGEAQALCDPATEDEVAKAKRHRQAVQLGVIGLCALLALQQLSTTSATEAVAAPDFSFDDIREEIESRIDGDRTAGDTEEADRWRRVLSTLQEARFLEVRNTPIASTMAATAYQRVVERAEQVEPSSASGALPDNDGLREQVVRFAEIKEAALKQ